MSDHQPPSRFPVELSAALPHIREFASRRHGFLVSRRITRRAMRRVVLTTESLWLVIANLEATDYEDGPMTDHHCADREVSVFRPIVGGQRMYLKRMYLKVAFRRVPDGPESALVVWSFHPPRFPLEQG